MMTAGIAAARPIAVASSASAMPGATTARLVVCAFEMPMKLFMMPQTVPNRPTKGEVEPIVANSPMPNRIRRPSAREISAKRDAARSLMPLSLAIPADSRASWVAASSSEVSTPLRSPNANCASADDLALPILLSAPASLLLATDNSKVLAIRIVQVRSDAKASPLITILTRMSADRNIDHGDNSCGTASCDFTDRALSVSAGTEADGDWADGGWVGADALPGACVALPAAAGSGSAVGAGGGLASGGLATGVDCCVFAA